MKTHREQLFKKLGKPISWSPSLSELSDETGVPKAALQAVYNRGIGAWKTNPESVRLLGSFKKDATAPRSARLSKEQWAMARVYSFLNHGKTFKTADADIAEKFKLT
jgi:hypothetical protein